MIIQINVLIDRGIKNNDVVTMFLVTNDQRIKGDKNNYNTQHSNEDNNNNNSKNSSNKSATSSQSDDSNNNKIIKSKRNKSPTKIVPSY